MLTPRLKNDLTGVVFIVIGVVLLIAATINSDALITSTVSALLHNGFGIGAYFLPIFIIIFGAGFFFLGRHELVMSRIALGMSLIFLAIIAFAGVNAPDAAVHPEYLFGPAYIQMCGGYVGNGIAYALLSLVGQIISWVLLSATIIGSLVLIGFSISGLFDWILDKKNSRNQVDESQFMAPYSRARGLEEDNAAFIPAGQTMPMSYDKGARKGVGAGKTKVLRGAQPTTQLGGDAEYDELMQGKSKRAAGVGKTRKLGNDIDLDSVLGEGAQGDAVENAVAGAAEAVGAATTVGAAAAGAAAAGAGAAAGSTKPTLLADSKREKSEEGQFVLPDPKWLKKSAYKPTGKSSSAELSEMGMRLQETLHEFNVDADVVGWVHGPTVTLFKVALASGVRVNKITALQDDIALAFASQSVRIFSPIAGTSLVGIEIPNDMRENVLLGDVLPPAGNDPMLMGIGKDVEGNAITANLAKMPHLLIGGTTGSGKSVAINSMIMSVLMRATPEEVRMILIDPKRVELSLYNDIPHLFVPVVTDPHKAASTLAWAVTEMERRLKLFEEVGARNITQYGKLREQYYTEFEQQKAELEAKRAQNSDQEFEDIEEDEWEHLPSIMIVIDELADLMMVAGKDVETSISRIAQLARAAGIHMIVATQRPSTNVITGLIKANITNRIAFNVASGIDSRVILDCTGAEQLIGLGDLLLSKPELGKPLRVQGCFVGEDEINTVCKFLREQRKPDYHEDIFTTAVPMLDSGDSSASGAAAGSDEELMWQAAEIVVQSNLGSTSALQRRLKVGYARAGRIMDMLEDKGIVGPANGSKPREVYVTDMEELQGLRIMDENGRL